MNVKIGFACFYFRDRCSENNRIQQETIETVFWSKFDEWSKLVSKYYYYYNKRLFFPVNCFLSFLSPDIAQLMTVDYRCFAELSSTV